MKTQADYDREQKEWKIRHDAEVASLRAELAAAKKEFEVVLDRVGEEEKEAER